MHAVWKWIKYSSLPVLAVVAVVLSRPQPIEIETGLVDFRPFYESVDAQGRTRARNPFLITAPIGGRLLRSTLEEGDKVNAGQVLASIAPTPTDQRMVAYAEASVTAAQARLNSAMASLAENRSTFARVSRELERREELYQRELASLEETELYRQLVEAERARVEQAEAAVLAAEADIDSARALLVGSDLAAETANAGLVQIRAPADGTVYKVLEKDERVVQAGTPIIEMSNQDSLEVVVDLLTQDAVQIEIGDAVFLTGWGGDNSLSAVVRTIEPEAFTKVSALGVEEQRVNVIADMVDAPDSLGAEYRVQASIVTWQGNSVLTVPTSALFQRADGWHVFTVKDDIVSRTPVLIASSGRDYARVQGCLGPGATVVLYPSDLIAEGVRVSTSTAP